MAIGRVKTDLITDSAITEAKLGVGTGSGTAITQWHVDNLTMNSNQLSTQNSSDLIKPQERVLGAGIIDH